MVIWPGVVADPPVDIGVEVSSPFRAELPYEPVISMAGVEEGDERFQRVAVGNLRVGGAWPGGGDEEVGHVTEVEVGVRVASARAGHDLAKEGGHGGRC